MTSSRRGAAASTPGWDSAAARARNVVYPQPEIRIDINAREACGSAVSRGQCLLLAGGGQGQDPDGRPE